MNPHSLPKKRELGAYYTPPELSQVLADWAIQHTSKDILEPSFGGCGFFDSSITRLRKLGCTSPEKKLYGVDIDQHAFNILSSKFGKSINCDKRFILRDFIQVKPSDFSISEFDVVLGNPPYVSMHNMTEEQRKSCDSVLRDSPFSAETMGRNASLWAFFLLHSLTFLKKGGRVAWVLPSSLLHADYAEKLIEIHQRHFEHIKVLKLAERFFKQEGAQETSIILLAEGFHKSPLTISNLSVSVVDTIDELKVAIGEQGIRSLNVKDYKLDIVSSAAKFYYQALLQEETTKEIGHYADIKIGMVTGANNYFIVNHSTAEKYQLPKDVLKPVVSRFSYLQGIVHDKHRHRKSAKEDQRVYLVCPTEEQMADTSSRVFQYLSEISIEERKNNRTFQKRPHWFAPGWGIDGVAADCFLSYMIHRGPRMVVNTGKQFNCTNSIHKVIFRDKTVSAKYKRAMALTMLSTFTQFSAEIEGRAYSSGVLKIEPSAGRRIKVLFSEECIDDLDALKQQVERAIGQEDFNTAAELVDSVLIEKGLITQEQCLHLSKAVHTLRRERYKGAKNYNE